MGREPRHRPPPWLNENLGRELTTLGRWKKKLRNAREAFTRRAIRAKFRKLKKTHKRNCFRARREAWRKFVTETGNAEPWGPVFKWLKAGGIRPSECIPAAIRKPDGSFTKSLRETGERLMESLVPDDSYDNESPEQMAARTETGIEIGSFRQVTDELGEIQHCETVEVKRAIWRMAPNKSPGLDGITAKIL
ncbi:unnamed protein product [Macrosiphum euphorbiae]|uniref:Reverse transcriptase n=1 Tax=Macrosiphum euphorbiae TaxID=13131 RepID=A0AAV0WGE3_9HEMI|nr:unnamed protein product [Macrosiphum euphorbiae]